MVGNGLNHVSISHVISDIDGCASNPCQSGGTCVDVANGYTCNCVAGYIGDHCQTSRYNGVGHSTIRKYYINIAQGAMTYASCAVPCSRL